MAQSRVFQPVTDASGAVSSHLAFSLRIASESHSLRLPNRKFPLQIFLFLRDLLLIYSQISSPTGLRRPSSRQPFFRASSSLGLMIGGRT
uniref:Uncharacterized protein n=1 Tax=Caenorhabditis tropicalis TaxID=1561998 RepID=A0A1I7UQ99_9PELO